jgi:hypothetical protein
LRIGRFDGEYSVHHFVWFAVGAQCRAKSEACGRCGGFAEFASIPTDVKSAGKLRVLGERNSYLKIWAKNEHF